MQLMQQKEILMTNNWIVVFFVKSDKNRRGPEQGELTLKGVDKSEGELDSSKPMVANEESLSKKHHHKKSKAKSKTRISLTLSPHRADTNSLKSDETTSLLRNRIKIQSLANEALVKDSQEFERRIYSSTPDTSMFFGGQHRADGAKSFLEEGELDFLGDNQGDGDEEQDEHEVCIQLEASGQKKAKKKNRGGKKALVAQASSDFNTEKDEDTLSSMT